MGFGPTARIDLVEKEGSSYFRATGGIGLTISANYENLEDALDMVHLFARLSWDVHQVSWHHIHP
jgi:hypothetical protein